jgi:hypothetical protein
MAEDGVGPPGGEDAPHPENAARVEAVAKRDRGYRDAVPGSDLGNAARVRAKQPRLDAACSKAARLLEELKLLAT